ncbi:MAG: DeoR/GlpR family DNA-binding transcription regulator [Planctomycetaceae bacterium]|nr:DeoR/GlpR family DNA-binding transcription regulator [Planctomycetaceae bacterium]
MSSIKKKKNSNNSKTLEGDIFAEERRQLILEFVNTNQRTTVPQLCEQFSVSPATARNDLRELERMALLKRTHGGAMSNSTTNYEPDSYQKEVENIESKQKIARAAVKQIRENDAIALDTGTTTFEIAKLLIAFKNLTVVTNDLQIASFLERHSNTNIIFVGGFVRKNFHCTTGQKAIEAISELNVDKCFIAVNGIDLKKGLSTPNLDIAHFKRKLLEISSQVVVVADSSKFGKISFVKFAKLNQVDLIITDEGIAPEMSDYFEKENVIVTIA